MSALLYQRISTDDLRKIINAYDDFDCMEKYNVNHCFDCPLHEIKDCSYLAFIEAFDKGEINFEEMEE